MAKELTVNLGEDKPGAFARAAEALGRAGVNIEGVTEVKGTVHFLVGDAGSARKALEGSGFKIQGERDVLVLEIADRPGELARITRKIADAGVNLEAVYLATRTRVVISASDLTKARQALAGASISG